MYSTLKNDPLPLRKSGPGYDINVSAGDGGNVRHSATLRVQVRATRPSGGQGQGPADDVLPGGQRAAAEPSAATANAATATAGDGDGSGGGGGGHGDAGRGGGRRPGGGRVSGSQASAVAARGSRRADDGVRLNGPANGRFYIGPYFTLCLFPLLVMSPDPI